MTTTTRVSLYGPHKLDTATIDRVITKTSSGVYLLSRDGKTAHYVGRSDVNLHARIKDHVGKGYTHFWYTYSTSAQDAFQSECHLYHDFGGATYLDNKIHPQRPANCNWRCPRCGYYPH